MAKKFDKISPKNISEEKFNQLVDALPSSVIEQSKAVVIPPEKKEKLDMPNIFERLKKKNLRTVVYPIHEPWADIGLPEDYLKVK